MTKLSGGYSTPFSSDFDEAQKLIKRSKMRINRYIKSGSIDPDDLRILIICFHALSNIFKSQESFESFLLTECVDYEEYVLPLLNFNPFGKNVEADKGLKSAIKAYYFE